MVQTSDETVPQSRLASRIQDESSKTNPAEESNEMVTLTKTQLRAILEALSQVGQSDLKSEQPETNKLKDKNVDSKSLSDTKNQCSSRYDSHTRNCSPQEETGTDSEFISNGKIDSVHTTFMSQTAINTNTTGVSRLERKRQQWAKERAEMEEWNPWGKPGAGAPRPRRASISSTFPRVESRAMLVQSPSNSSYPTRSSLSSPLQAYRSPCVTPDESPSPHLTAFSQSVTKPSRNAFSFAQDSIDSTEETKTQWLERQRDEERQRCLLDHDRLHLSRQFNVALMTEQKTENESSSICPTLNSRTSAVEGKIFLRGQGLVAEPEDVAKARERRQKALEYQREVQRQMEEKKSKEREEKQRKILEEQEEEKRLEVERIRMQKEFEEEQRRQKEKEELEERKRKLLIAAMEQAQAAAEAARKATKAQRFQSCPELSFNQRKTQNDQETISSAESKEQIVDEEEKSKVILRLDQRTATVHPVQNSPATPELKQQREFAVQTSLIPDSTGYIENRVLTPTVVRLKEKARSQHKEFGTQTDFHLVDHWLRDDPYSPISTSSSLTSIEQYKKNRIKHSQPTKVSQNSYGSSFNQQKWGVSAQQKPYVKMSERDPHYHKRKRLLELRRQHWEREIASQRAFTETRRSILSSQSTNKPLSRKKKVISSSEGSLSSSEGEEKYDQQENIRSLPCFLKSHYQHTHGSADDVTEKIGRISNNRDYYSDSHSSTMQRGRLAQSTENLLSYPFSESLHSRTSCQNFTFPSGQSHHPSMRRKWHSQETFLPQSPSVFSIKCTSPPVPAVQKRLGEQQDEIEVDAYHAPRRKWTDQEGYSPEDIPHSNAQCTSTSPFDGKEINDGRKPDTDPLVHPEIVTRRPTARQDKILMQLSSLRQGLLLKQRELENQLLHPACETS